MSLESRRELIQKIEQIRGSNVICYLTSVRQNVIGNIAEDVVRVFFDHLLQLPARPVEKLDIFIVSNGGQSTVPWRLTALFREFAKHVGMLVPYRAYSAATLLCLGADEILMHPFGELGPIDPSVSNEFNPKDEQTGQLLAISVEDVKAYVNFVKVTVGITHEDELVRAIEVLAQRVHPLALGNVERFISQSRMVARKILKTHMTKPEDEHTIDEIVENMASRLFFHGHPINRVEAETDLRLKVKRELQPDLETAIWDLYVDFEQQFEGRTIFNPVSDLAAQAISLKRNPPLPDPAQVVQLMQQGLNAEMATAIVRARMQPVIETESTTLHAVVESARLSSRFEVKRRWEQLPGQQPGQPIIREDVLAQEWIHSPAP